VPSIDEFHSFERLMRSFVATNNGAQGTGNFADLYEVRIAALDYDSLHYVSLRKDAE
jgi:hypothetical protein